MAIDIEDEAIKREKFRSLLLKLANNSQTTLENDKDKEKIYDELVIIYLEKTEFRHYYSDIFAVLSQIENEPDKGSIDVLSQNMDILRRDYIPKSPNSLGAPVDITEKINKLYDHVNLDVSRLNFLKTSESRSIEKLAESEKAIEEVRTVVKAIKTNAKEASKMQTQYITILGIFASIVLAFTGGIAFSTSVLENISKSSVYRILLIAIIIAFVLINTVYILTRFILEINKTAGQKITYPVYMWIINLILGIGILLVFCGWILNFETLAVYCREWIYGKLNIS